MDTQAGGWPDLGGVAAHERTRARLRDDAVARTYATPHRPRAQRCSCIAFVVLAAIGAGSQAVAR